MKLIECKSCGYEIAKNDKICPSCGAKNKKPLFKKWWFWVVIIFVLIIGTSSGGDEDTTPAEVDSVVSSVEVAETAPESEQEENRTTTEPMTVETMEFELVAGEAGEYGELFTINKGTEFEETYYIYHVPSGTYTVTNTGEYMSQVSVYSDEIVVTEAGWEEPAEVFYAKALDIGISDTVTVVEGSYIEIHEPARFTFTATMETDPETSETTPEQTTEPENNVSTEYKNALKKAESYARTMSMSKTRIYYQLTSEYGENFPEEAAQYAIDNIEWDWNANALEKAKSYSDTMYMSKARIYDQLISEYGEQFTEEEAQYAVDNLDADYKTNALEKAKSYYEDMSMSKDRVYEQLISEYGEQFTAEEAQYAIDNLE